MKADCNNEYREYFKLKETESMGLENQLNPKKSNNGCMLTLLVVFITTFLEIFLSCNNQQRNNAIFNEENKSFQKESKQKPSLPDGFYLGQVKSYEAKNQIEKNLLSQINTYNNALFRKDIKGASSYLYPDAIIYFRKYYPNSFTDNDIINEFYKAVSDELVNGIQLYEDKGMNLDLIVNKIDRTIDSENTIFCVFGLTLQISGGGKFFYAPPANDDYLLGISLNNGKNWYFLSLNDDTPNILRLKFSNETISQVMGY